MNILTRRVGTAGISACGDTSPYISSPDSGPNDGSAIPPEYEQPPGQYSNADNTIHISRGGESIPYNISPYSRPSEVSSPSESQQRPGQSSSSSSRNEISAGEENSPLRSFHGSGSSVGTQWAFLNFKPLDMLRPLQ